jgi:chromosome segregation ATPase
MVAGARASPKDAALAVLRKHDMAKPLGRMRAMQEVAVLYDAHASELTARLSALEGATAQRARHERDATAAHLEASQAALEHAERAATLELELHAERAVAAQLRDELARALLLLEVERYEAATRETERDAEVAHLGALLEERRPLEAHVAKLDAALGELNAQLVDAERQVRAERADKALLARAVLRDQAYDLGGLQVETIVHVVPDGVHATHLRPSGF